MEWVAVGGATHMRTAPCQVNFLNWCCLSQIIDFLVEVGMVREVSSHNLLLTLWKSLVFDFNGWLAEAMI